jgi:hypothetical protein
MLRSIERFVPQIVRAAPEAVLVAVTDPQLAGPYGRQDGLYLRPPFQAGAKNQDKRSAVGPAERYRVALLARDRACKASNAGKLFAELPDNDKDAVLSGSKARNRSSTERMGKRSLRKRSETCKLAFSPIKSTAAIVTWSPGK